MTMAARTTGRAPRPSSLADVLEVVLDKGIVIDAYVRVALVGIEILTIDARIVIASVDTYLRFAEPVNRLDLQAREQEQVTGLPGLVRSVSGGINEGGAQHKTKGALEGVKETAQDFVSSLRGDDGDEAQIDSGARSEHARSGGRDLPPGRAAPNRRAGARHDGGG